MSSEEIKAGYYVDMTKCNVQTLVYSPGSKVWLNEDMKATVKQVAIGLHGVEYQVVYYVNTTRHETWVMASEVTEFDGSPQRTIGFRNK